MDVESKPANNETAMAGPSIDLFRGVDGAIQGCAIGFMGVAVFFIFAMGSNTWWKSGETNWGYAVSQATEWAAPLMGCTLVCMCAGWATYAPAVNGKSYRYADTLCRIVIVSLPIYFIAKFVQNSIDPPFRGRPVLIYEILFAPLPVLLVTAALTVLRMRQKACVTIP